jgi:flagellar hook-length control protein FliK
MSVNTVNDKTQDLFGATDTSRSQQDRANTADKETAPSAEARFAQILKGRLETNVSFTRADQQLKMPEKASADKNPTPIYNRRDDRARDQSIDDAPRDDRGQDDRTTPVAHAPVEPSQRRDLQNGPADRSSVAQTGTGANENTAPASSEKGTTQAGDAKANSAATQSNGSAKEAQQAAAAQVAKGESVSPEILEQAKKAVQNSGPKMTATVTDDAVQISSQPQNTLSAKAAVAADTAAKKGDAAALSQAEAEGDATAEADSAVNNIFNRVKGDSKKANAQGANAAQNGADPSKVGAAAQQAAAAANPTVNTQQVATSMGTQASSLTGSTQSGTTVDAATGTTASLGANNSIQQRGTPAPTANASRPPPVPAHVVADQVAVNISRGLAQGNDRITIQLRPAELGRVEVKMEMTHEGKMTAIVSAERPETLDMLRQDARTLLQSLNNAGLQADQNSLSFTLQNQNSGNGSQQNHAQGNNVSGQTADGLDDLINTGFIFEQTGGFDGDGRLDVKI